MVNKYDFCASQLSSETLDDAVTETDGASLRYDGTILGSILFSNNKDSFVGVRLAGRSWLASSLVGYLAKWDP